ncbi:hypothetical protein AAMO2058_000083800 [Amorphochlora amoebiformis]
MPLKDLWRRSAREVRGMVKEGKVTSLDLIDECEARWKATEKFINATPIPCFDLARYKAAELLKSENFRKNIESSNSGGYLFGLPVVVKDTLAVEGVRFTEGSQVYRDRIASYSDPVVEVLERNGAIVIGKSNTSEFAAGSNTFNNVFGTTYNPFQTAKTAGGSSGGSAAALAAGQCWLAVGSDLGGSLRIPASFCGVVGLRPSLGIVPRSHPADTCPSPEELHSVNGPLARNCGDLELLLRAMKSTQGWTPECHPPENIFDLSPAEAEGRWLASQRIAWTPNLGLDIPVHQEVSSSFSSSVDWFRSQGCEISQAHISLEAGPDAFLILRAIDFAKVHNKRQRSMCKPEIQWNAELGDEIIGNTEILERGWSILKRMRHQIDSMMNTYSHNGNNTSDPIDFLITPTVFLPPFDASIRYLSRFESKQFGNYIDWLAFTSAVDREDRGGIHTGRGEV